MNSLSKILWSWAKNVEETSFMKTIFFLIFGQWDSLICFSFNVLTLSKELPVFLREVFGRLLKTVQMSTRKKWGFFFQKSLVLKPISDNDLKYAASWQKFFLAELSKLHSKFTWDYSEENHYLIQKVFHSFSITEQKKINFLSKCFRQASQNCILHVQRNCSRRRKLFFPKKKQNFECF